MVRAYADNARRNVPGLDKIHLMLLLAAPADECAHILDSGGGLETKAMAEDKTGWRFMGVDLSTAMLLTARTSLTMFDDRVQLSEGTIDPAEGFFANLS